MVCVLMAAVVVVQTSQGDMYLSATQTHSTAAPLVPRNNSLPSALSVSHLLTAAVCLCGCLAALRVR